MKGLEKRDCPARLLLQITVQRAAVIVEAVVDPYEPPMPPKATLEQSWQLAKSLARGTPDAGRTVSTIMKDKIKELV